MRDEVVAQGAVIASILAGFAFIGSTSTARQRTIIKYFSAGMLMLVSIMSGLASAARFVVATTPDRIPLNSPAGVVVTLYILSLLGGVYFFIEATTDHIAERSIGNTAKYCRWIGRGTYAAILLVLAVAGS